ncbi:MAG: glycosyltransferase family 4 protein [Lachnospiraceae bacterium]|nr:glycosyltransferase family 4 protein [Lachnospiraceae bacterium]
MKLLIDLTSLADNFSGIERFASSITKELVKYKEHEYILVFKNQVHKGFENLDNVTNVVVKGKNKLIFNQLRLPVKLWGLKADYYIFPAFPAPFLFLSKKSISAIHDMGCWDCPETNKKHMVAYFKILYRKAAMGGKKIITVSEFSKSRIVDILKVNCEDVWVIYNGISDCFLNFKYDEAEDIRIRNKLSLPQQYILCLSTIEPRKNMRLLIDAYVEMREKNFEQELVLAGRKGWMVDTLLKGISENTRSHIHFTGFVDDNELPYVYYGADVFVFPSLYEGFGIPPLEALACGTPVLSSNAASMPEVLGDEVAFFDNNDKDSLKRRIEDILFYANNGEYQQRKSKLIITKYLWNKEAKKLLENLANL